MNGFGEVGGPTRSDLRRAFRRCFAIQGSWNPRTFIGCGLAYAMLPLLRAIYARDPAALREAVGRHASLFNGHPYLCPLAVTALARLELEGKDSAWIGRFRAALVGPLGAIGDRLVWSGWLPFCLLGAILLNGLGIPAAACAVGFLLVYNAGHVGLRWWAFRTGWVEGAAVGRTLARTALRGWARRLRRASLVAMGAAVVLFLPQLPGAGGWGSAVAVASAGFLAGGWAPDRISRLPEWLLVGALVVSVLP